MRWAMNDLPERLFAFYESLNAPPSPGVPDGAEVVLEARDEIERLRVERDTWRSNANAWATLAAERGGNLNVDHAKEITRLREALRRANEVSAPYANHFGMAKHVADITKEALGG